MSGKLYDLVYIFKGSLAAGLGSDHRGRAEPRYKAITGVILYGLLSIKNEKWGVAWTRVGVRRCWEADGRRIQFLRESQQDLQVGCF